MKKRIMQLLSVVIAVVMVCGCVPMLSAVAAETEITKTITAFAYDNSGKTSGNYLDEYADLENSSMYVPTVGAGVLSGSITGADLKQPEWSSDTYSDSEGNQVGIVPVFTASDTDNWGAPYICFTAQGLSDYHDISVSFELAGTKKGPADFIVTATDGQADPIQLGTCKLSVNKVMTPFSFDLPEALSDADSVTIRINVDGEATIAGKTLSANPTGGEMAVNNIRLAGVSNNPTEPEEPVYTVTTEQLQALVDSVPADLSDYTDESAAELKAFMDENIGLDTKQTPELTWSMGALDPATGNYSGSSSWIRTGMIDTSAFNSVVLNSDGGIVNVYWYDENGKYMGSLFEENKNSKSMRNYELPVLYPYMRIIYWKKNCYDPSYGSNVSAVFSDRVVLSEYSAAETEALYNELDRLIKQLVRITPQTLLDTLASQVRYPEYYTDESTAELKGFIDRLGKGEESALSLNWAQGGINSGTGVAFGGSHWIRTSYLDMKGFDYLKMIISDNRFNLYYYDENKQYIGSLFDNGSSETLKYSIFRVKCRYIRIGVFSSAGIKPDMDTTLRASVISSASLDGFSDAQVVSMYRELEDILSHTQPVYKTAEVPQVYISTAEENGNELLKRTGYVTASFSVVDTDGSVLTAPGKIKVRGNSTAYAEKKPYNIKFDKKQNVFGFGAAKKWALLANAYDATMLRNNIAQQLAQHVGLDYTSNIRTVEVWIDGFYKGCYDLAESVEVGPTRVDINIEGNNDFLLERESLRVEEGVSYVTTDGIRFSVNEPEEPTTEQIAYISESLDNVTDTLKTLDYDAIREVMDIDSFVKFYVVNEVMRPADFRFSSTRYYYKDGVLYAGPCWDFDISSGNTITKGYTTMPIRDGQFYNYLFQIDEFTAKVKDCFRENYDYLEKIGADQGLIDNMLAQYGNVYARNYDNTDWTLDMCYYTNHTRIPDPTLDENMAFCKQWFSDRVNFLFDYYDIEPAHATTEHLRALIDSVPADLSAYTAESAAELRAFMDEHFGRDDWQVDNIVWRQGALKTTTGKISRSSYFINTEMIDVSAFNSVVLNSTNGKVNVFWYDENGNFMGSLFADSAKSQEMHDRELSVDHPYMRIVYRNSKGCDPTDGSNVSAVFSNKVPLDQFSEEETDAVYHELEALIRQLEPAAE